MIKRFKHSAKQRQVSVRLKTRGSADRPRLTVFRSNRYLYAQIINDAKGVTLAAAKGIVPESVGTALAQAALKKKVSQVVFDRGPYRYHGRIKKLADAARKGGLQF